MRGPRVLLFVQEGCHFCSDYEKVFEPIAERYPHVPVHRGDVAREPNAQRLANRYRVQATPTTIGIDRHGRAHRLEGSVSAAAVRAMMDAL